MKESELSLRLCDLMGAEKKRGAKRKKKARWAEYLDRSVPAILASGQNREWVQRLKEKLRNNIEL